MRGPAAFAASLVSPPRCVVCAAATASRQILCGGCDAELRAARPQIGAVAGIDATWSAAAYSGAPRAIVAALKFGGLLPLACRIALQIAETAPAALLDGTLVPVPASPLRLRTRGFDAAEEIARELGRISGQRMEPCLRRRGGPRQVGRPRAERLASPPRVTLRGRAPSDVVLVDDVRTTGATLAACAAALRGAGAEHVVAVTFASSRKAFGATAPRA